MRPQPVSILYTSVARASGVPQQAAGTARAAAAAISVHVCAVLREDGGPREVRIASLTSPGSNN
jgi:hypothetical protein